MKVKQGLIVAESLKKRIRETRTNSRLTPSPSPPTTATSSLSSPSINPHDNRKFNHKSEYEIIHFVFLVDLNNSTDKELIDAYQHCLNGNQLVNINIF